MALYLGKDSILDTLADSHELVRRLPHYEDRYKALEEIRDQHDDLSKISNWGRLSPGEERMRRVASIPIPVLELALVHQPDLLRDKKKFYAWMDRHPEHYTYKRIKR